jgi:hypothetical protein
MTVHIHKIDTNRWEDVCRFVDFPFKLYHDCPQWAPPLRGGARRNLDRGKHPFYQHSTADFFLAERDGQTLGRIAAINNRNYNAYRGARRAFFGYFDAVEDVEVAQALFEAVFEWARAQGLDEIGGPKGLLGADESYVLVDGFEHRAAMGVTYNFPYYERLIQAVGFQKDTDYFSGYIEGERQLPARYFSIADRVKRRSGFQIKTFRNKREIRRWIPRVLQAHREALQDTHTYYPPTDRELDTIIDTVFAILDPRLVKLVMKGDQIVGFLLVYHDLSAALQETEGRLWPLGWFNILRERRRTRWANINGLGVLPEYQGLGATALIYTELAKTLQQFNFQHIDVVQVEEGNIKSRNEIEGIGVTWYKTHRGYCRTL